ncbi:MAG: glutathione S-transferase, partial [Enterobacterales bacterium]
KSNGLFCFGNSATLADLYLIPQVYNARRFKIDLTEFPTITSIEAHCLTLEAFQKAVPEAQADA